MLRDPKAYPSPETFNPDRYLKDGKFNPEVQDPATIAFGFGRRYAVHAQTSVVIPMPHLVILAFVQDGI